MKEIHEKLEADYSDRPEPYSPPQWPTFVYSDDDELPIPAKGKMLINYEETRKVKEVRNGKTTYTCTISVKEIISVEGESEDKKDTKADDALDAIKEALEKENVDSEDAY